MQSGVLSPVNLSLSWVNNDGQVEGHKDILTLEFTAAGIQNQWFLLFSLLIRVSNASSVQQTTKEATFQPFALPGVNGKQEHLGCAFQLQQAARFFVKLLRVKHINKHVHREKVRYFNTGFFLQSSRCKPKTFLSGNMGGRILEG